MDSIVMLEGPDTRAAEIEVFRTEFLCWAAEPDLTKPCPVGRAVPSDALGRTRRLQTIAEVVFDAMTNKADFELRAMVLLCEMANWNQPARELLSDMAEHWAELRCDL